MKDQFLPWSLLALVRMVSADLLLPYNPTRILTTPNSTYAYILQQRQDSTQQGSLTAVDLQRTFAMKDVSPTSLYSSLPFLRDDTLVPYTPIIDDAGNITVIAGSCTDGAGSTEVWRFALETGNGNGNGTWIQHQTSAANPSGVKFLNNGVAFSANVHSSSEELDFYMFGGMCSYDNSTAETRQTAAEYSNTMLTLQSTGDGTYDIASVASRGPPVAEAGFSMTGLTPTFRVNATGEAQTQQQDFLFLGGHTQEAFINTSQVALFSLPQNSWSFLPVQQPSPARTDLAARQTTSNVEPRSGHTAVLSQDGTSIIVLGGWVGDVSNPAQPQLAVLHLGSEYGGDVAQAWTWSIPTQTGTGIADGSGIYGHGATLLPGGVMMIVGGYQIPASSSSRFKRQSQQNILLYNTTSNSWVDSYTNPSISEAASGQSPSSGLLSKTSQQTGLGVGLGLGVLLLVALIILYFWYAKRLNRKREEREQALLVHSSDGSQAALDQPFLDQGGIDGRGGDMYAGGQHQQMSQQAGATGLFTNIPSPTRGLRKGLASRPYSYHATPRYDESRLNGGSGHIHPILERQDEDDMERSPTPRNPLRDSHALQEPEQVYDNYSTAEAKLKELQRVLKSGTGSSPPVRDPFADLIPNPLGSHPTSPVAAGTQTLRRVPTHHSHEESPPRRPLTAETDGSMNWQIIEHDEEEPSGSGSGSSNGRISPTKSDDRTSSTLSERSQRSVGSTTSITRTMSTRTGAMLAAAFSKREAEETAATTPADAQRTNTMSTTASTSGRKSPYYFQHSHHGSKMGSKRGSRDMEPTHHTEKSTDSFMTASSSFAQLQNEGEALLGSRPMRDRDDPYQRALAAHSSTMQPRTAETEYHNPPQKIPGWVGSLRRALTAMSNDRSFSLTSQSKSPISPVEVEPRPSSSSPTRARKAGTSDGPQRATSDGGALLRQKRGQQDWQDANAAAGDWGEPRSSFEAREAEGEWDVEGAASKRDFQVMFSVPKARLRVVNADVDRASMRSASDGATISRRESMVNLKREGSVNTVRSRSDGENGHKERQKMLLGSTEEVEEGAVSSGVRIR